MNSATENIYSGLIPPKPKPPHGYYQYDFAFGAGIASIGYPDTGYFENDSYEYYIAKTIIDGASIVGNSLYAQADSAQVGFDITEGVLQGGAGLYASFSDVVMKSGYISNNTSNVSGGGIYVDSAAKFNLTGGSISGNMCAQFGGGIMAFPMDYLYYETILLDIQESADILGDVEPVPIEDLSRLPQVSINGGEIINNFANSAGGGIANIGNVLINGGVISGNQAQYFGGGIFTVSIQALRYLIDEEIPVYIKSLVATVNLTGGSITNNSTYNGSDTSVEYIACGGGGIYNLSSEVNISGNVDIESNHSAGVGGGVYYGCPIRETSTNNWIGKKGVYEFGYMSIKGSPVVVNNTQASGSGKTEYSNLYLDYPSDEFLEYISEETGQDYGDPFLRVADLSSNALVGVSCQKYQKIGEQFALDYYAEEGSNAVKNVDRIRCDIDPYLQGQLSKSDPENIIWGKASIKISFESNGGSGDMKTVEEPCGSTYVVPWCDFYPPAGAEFYCWQIKGTEDYLFPEQEIEVPTHDMTLVAQWQVNESVTIYLEPGAGQGEVQTVDVPCNDFYIVPPCTFKAPAGKEFAGWLVEGTEWILQPEWYGYAGTEDITLIAQWQDLQPLTYTVKFDKNGGSGIMKSVEVPINEAYEVDSCTFVPPAGYEFSGWKYTDSKGVEKIVQPKDKITLTGDITLYAQWKKLPAQTEEVFRLYNPNTGEHFFTAKAEERESLVAAGWINEDIAWVAPKSGKEVYRLYNSNAGEHFYTMDANEKDGLVKAGWTYEDVAFYSADETTGVPIYRVYNPNAVGAGSHMYTANEDEYNGLISNGWIAEGVAFYGCKN